MHLLYKITFLAISYLPASACRWLADRMLNTVIENPPYEANVVATKLHKQLTIVDLHSDFLMWNRDLLQRSSHGHVDVPRLLEGNVSLQVFSVVTAVPFPAKLENNEDKGDVLNLITQSKDWPQVTHTSRLQRALYQADKLANFIQASEGKLKLICDQQDLQMLLRERAQGSQVIGTLLSLEGTHALEGTVENIGRLYQAGFRLLGLAHFIDNAMAGSVHGIQKQGLTDKGQQLIRRAVELGMIIDLSHSSTQAIDDVLAIVNVAVIASHGGVRGTCDTVRNLEDRHIHAIANSGGIIGIGLYKQATCSSALIDIVRAMRYISDLVGVDHVALGSDFDGSVATVFDASGWVKLTEALLNAGFTTEEVRAIMGGNAIRVFKQILPAK